MNKDAIITLPNPHLREKSSRVSLIDDSTRELVNNMTAASLDWEASRPHEISAALAAVQVDVQARVIIVRSNFEDKSDKSFTAFINPEIIKYEGAQLRDFEGCLSVPGVYGKVPRFNRVRVRALTTDGHEVRFKADGFFARVIQHELDHTKGVLFIDHIKDQHDAFYELDNKGELIPLDYEKHVATNRLLWD